MRIGFHIKEFQNNNFFNLVLSSMEAIKDIND